MRRNLFFALFAPLAFLVSCNDSDSSGESGLPASMSSVEFSGALPCVDFYASDAKTAIINYETAAMRSISIDELDGMDMVFASQKGNVDRVYYHFRTSRQFDEAELRGRSSEDVWNKEFIALLRSSGYETTGVSDSRVELLSLARKVKVEVVRINGDGIAAAYFTPTEALPQLPDFSVELIHPFHTFGATLEEIKAAEAAEGRTLYRVDGNDQLFRSYGPEDSIFNVFGFRIDEEGKLYYVMSVLRDGDYLDTEEFKTAMAADGFVYERREGSYTYFRDAANTVVVRAANLAPNPTIEYIDPDSVMIE